VRAAPSALPPVAGIVQPTPKLNPALEPKPPLPPSIPPPHPHYSETVVAGHKYLHVPPSAIGFAILGFAFIAFFGFVGCITRM